MARSSLFWLKKQTYECEWSDLWQHIQLYLVQVRATKSDRHNPYYNMRATRLAQLLSRFRLLTLVLHSICHAVCKTKPLDYPHMNKLCLTL